MLPVTIPVDAERAAIEYLLPYVDGVPIDVRGGGGRFVRVRRIGGVEISPQHDRPVLDVMIWHDDDHSRMQLAMKLWAYLRAAAGDTAGDAVITFGSTTLGPRQMPDPADETKVVCLLTVELIMRPA